MGGQPGGQLSESGRAVVEFSRGRLCGQCYGEPPVRAGQHAHLADQIATRRIRSPAAFELSARYGADAPPLIGVDAAHQREDRCVCTVAQRS